MCIRDRSSNSLNVDQTGIVANNLWTYTGSEWGVLDNTLANLSNVSITAPANGQALTFSTGSSTWINSTPSGGASVFETYATDNIRTIGTNCGTALSDCIFIGQNAGNAANPASTRTCIAVGVNAAISVSSTFVSSVVFGSNARPSPFNDVIIGHNTSASATSGSSVSIGMEAGQLQGSSESVNVGYQANLYSGSFVSIGSLSSSGDNTGRLSSVKLGYNSAQSRASSSTVCIGSEAGNSFSSTVSVGYRAGLPQSTSGGICTVGATDQPSGFQHSSSTVIGADVQYHAGSANVIMGYQAGQGPVQATDSAVTMFQLGGSAGGAFLSDLQPIAWSAAGGEVQTTVGNPAKYIDVTVENSGVASTYKLYLWG